MVSRRTTILGLGGLLVGGGALLGTGAFNTIEAQRSVSLETAGDANAFLGLEILDGAVVDETDGTIEFDLLADATTTYEDLINVRNNGTQTVTSLRFEFIVEGAEQDDGAAEDALKIISGDATIDAVDELNLLFESDAGDAGDDELAPGQAVPIGIAIDLTDEGIDRIDGDPEITLRIIADTGEVADDPGGPPGQAAFEYTDDGEPTRGPENSVEFTIENVGSAGASLDAFNIDVDTPGQPPDDLGGFDGFEIETPDGSTINGDGGTVGEDTEHEEYDISPGETAEYTIEFERNISANGEVDLTLVSTDDVRFGLGGIGVKV